MGWRVARSLLTLRAQLDAAYPDRSRASDGTIGDAAHQASVSDHNPDGGGVVRALDVTHDPAGGLDIGQLSDALIANRDPRISYVIANRLISGPEYGWQWADYYGDDPHTNHLHLSVVADGRADDTRPWQIGSGGSNDMGTLDGIDPYDGTTPQAAELRDAFFGFMTGWQPPVASKDGVIARLIRIEDKVSAPSLDYMQLARALVQVIREL